MVNSANKTLQKHFRLGLALLERSESPGISSFPNSIGLSLWSPDSSDQQEAAETVLPPLCASHYAHPRNTLIGYPPETDSLIGQRGIWLSSANLKLCQTSPAAQEPWRLILMSTTASH